LNRITAAQVSKSLPDASKATEAKL